MNDTQRELLKALKGGRIVEVVSKYTDSIQYGVVIGNIISYIYPGGYDSIKEMVKEYEGYKEYEDYYYYINRVFELKDDAIAYINTGKDFKLNEEDYNVVYTRKKRLTFEDMDYDIEYFMICKGRTGCIVKCNFGGVDYIITRADKQSEYISIEPLETVKRIVNNNYTIYETEEEFNNNLVDEDDNFENEYPY